MPFAHCRNLKKDCSVNPHPQPFSQWEKGERLKSVTDRSQAIRSFSLSHWERVRVRSKFMVNCRRSVTYANSGEPSATRTCEPLVKYRLLYRRRAATGLLNLTEEIWSGRRGSNPHI